LLLAFEQRKLAPGQLDPLGGGRCGRRGQLGTPTCRESRLGLLVFGDSLLVRDTRLGELGVAWSTRSTSLRARRAARYRRSALEAPAG
jgi:hypothetical protein